MPAAFIRSIFDYKYIKNNKINRFTMVNFCAERARLLRSSRQKATIVVDGFGKRLLGIEAYK